MRSLVLRVQHQVCLCVTGLEMSAASGRERGKPQAGLPELCCPMRQRRRSCNSGSWLSPSALLFTRLSLQVSSGAPSTHSQHP